MSNGATLAVSESIIRRHSFPGPTKAWSVRSNYTTTTRRRQIGQLVMRAKWNTCLLAYGKVTKFRSVFTKTPTFSWFQFLHPMSRVFAASGTVCGFLKQSLAGPNASSPRSVRTSFVPSAITTFTSTKSIYLLKLTPPMAPTSRHRSPRRKRLHKSR